MPQPARDRDIDAALEVFVRGFSFTRGLIHPYVAERIAGMWVVRDAPRTSGQYRNEEWFAHGITPHIVDRAARQHTRGRFAVCVILGNGRDDGELRAEYKSLGYRLRTTEPIMVHSLKRIAQCDSPAEIERVTTREMAEQLAKAAGSRQVLHEHLGGDAPMRQYVASVDGRLVGWVRSIIVGKATWCSNMYVRPKYRRRGIGRAMLCRMLRDDRAGGSRIAVLSASHTGAKLYTVVGYERIAALYLLTPRR